MPSNETRCAHGSRVGALLRIGWRGQRRRTRLAFGSHSASKGCVEAERPLGTVEEGVGIDDVPGCSGPARSPSDEMYWGARGRARSSASSRPHGRGRPCQCTARRSTSASTGALVLPAARPSASTSAMPPPARRCRRRPRHAAPPQRDVPAVERVADGVGAPGERRDVLLHAAHVALLQAGDVPQPATEELERPSPSLGDGDDLARLRLAVATCVGPAMASQWAASARASTIGSSPGPGPLPPRRGPAGERRREREGDRQAGQHVARRRQPRRAGEGAGGLLEEVDLALVEQPDLEAREVGAEPERGAGHELGRAPSARARPARRTPGRRPPRRRRGAGPARAPPGRRPRTSSRSATRRPSARS